MTVFLMSDFDFFSKYSLTYSKTKSENGQYYIEVTCPLCKIPRWIRKGNAYREKTTGFCTQHRWAAQVKWAKPNEFDDSSNIIV